MVIFVWWIPAWWWWRNLCYADDFQEDDDCDLHLMNTNKMVIIINRMKMWFMVIYICDEYQQDGDRVVVKTVVTVSVGWDQTGWRKISSFERQKNQKLFPQKTSPKSQTKSIDRGGGIKIKKTYQTFDRYARGRYTVGKSVGKKSGGEIFYRATMIPNQKAKKMQFNSSLVERSSECQDTFLVEVAALRSFIDAKAFKCNTAPHCNVIGRHCTIREIRSSQSMLKPETFSVHKNIGRLTTTKYIMAYWQVVSHSTRWSSPFILGPLHWSSIFIFLTSREHKNIVQWCTNWQATLAQYFTCCYSSLAT